MTTTPEQNDSSPLQDLFWRDEVLQVMFWMRGEGLGEACQADQLATFLNTTPLALSLHLERMVTEQYLTREQDQTLIRYSLTESGRALGAKLFLEEFVGLTDQGHGECNNPNCACKTMGPQACESRSAHRHA